MVRVVAVPQLGRLSGACRIEDSVVKADMRGLTVYTELNGKSASALVDVNAINARLVTAMAFLVPAVFHLADITQVAYSVIARITVDMVDSFCRPFTVLVKPRQPVGLPYASVHVDSDVSSSLGCGAHNIASLPAGKFRTKLILPGMMQAREYPRFGVIMNVIFKLFLGDHADTSVKAVEGLRQPLTGWWFGSYPSRELSLTKLIDSRQSL